MKSSRYLVAALMGVIAVSAAASDLRRGGDRRVEPTVQWNHGWADGTVLYEVFVRSFADSDGDGVGDLRGLIDRLDYLNDGDPATSDDLGVGGLWLMPVFASPSYHGYDTTDYEKVKPDYGTLADFEELAAECHRRGIRLVLDLVLNHTSSDHPWFVTAAAGPTSELRSHYVWRSIDPGWTQPWGGSSPTWHLNPIDGTFYYGIFWGGMPDLDYREPAVRAEAARLARLWLDRGADGFRLDAVRYLIEDGAGRGQQDTPETHAFWREFSQAVRSHRPDALLVGESWADTATIATFFGSTTAISGGDELPSAFDFPLAEAILDGVLAADRRPIEEVLTDATQLYPEGVRDAPFLSNHDQVRTATRLGSDVGRLRSAASVVLTVPGLPFLYYGEEVGLRNGTTSGDEAKRSPMPWNDTSPGGGFTTGQPWFAFSPGRDIANVEDQSGQMDSLLAHYRGLIRARSGSVALAAGRLSLPDHPNTDALVLLRESADERVLVVVNLGARYFTAAGIEVDGRPIAKIYGDGFTGDLTGGPGNLSVFLPPHATAIWRISGPSGPPPAD
jgi:glycosidase